MPCKLGPKCLNYILPLAEVGKVGSRWETLFFPTEAMRAAVTMPCLAAKECSEACLVNWNHGGHLSRQSVITQFKMCPGYQNYTPHSCKRHSGNGNGLSVRPLASFYCPYHSGSPQAQRLVHFTIQSWDYCHECESDSFPVWGVGWDLRPWAWGYYKMFSNDFSIFPSKSYSRSIYLGPLNQKQDTLSLFSDAVRKRSSWAGKFTWLACAKPWTQSPAPQNKQKIIFLIHCTCTYYFVRFFFLLHWPSFLTWT
jgi:hypothetical protein